MEQIIFTALAKDPKQRFSSIQAFAMALTQASQMPQHFSPQPASFYPSSPLPTPSYPTLPFSLPYPSGNLTIRNSAPDATLHFNNGPTPHTPPSPLEMHLDQQFNSTAILHPPFPENNGKRRGILLVILLLLLVIGTTFTYITFNKKSQSISSPTPMAAIAKPTPTPMAAIAKPTPTPMAAIAKPTPMAAIAKPTPTPALATYPGSTVSGYYKLVNHSSGKVLEVSGFSTANGGTVDQWTNNGGTNQQWSLVLIA